MKLRDVDSPSGRVQRAGASKSCEDSRVTFCGLLRDTRSEAAVESNLDNYKTASVSLELLELHKVWVNYRQGMGSLPGRVLKVRMCLKGAKQSAQEPLVQHGFFI